MFPKIFNIYKKQGQTPLFCIKELKKSHPELSNLPITYAGRLDPLAEGVLLLLVGDECYKKDDYLSLPKEYEVEVLFGFSTDTYDLLGKVVDIQTSREELFERSSDLLAKDFEGRGQIVSNSSFRFAFKIQEILLEFIGKIKQKYPPYSSRTVKGKPLFMWAREGKLNEIEIPTHDVFIEKIDILGNKELAGKDLLRKIKEVINKVEGDFRQEEILKIWEKALENSRGENFLVLNFRISCGSGFYARVFAHNLGQAIDYPSLAFKITRTKVGEYTI